MTKVQNPLLFDMISALILEEIMWKRGLKWGLLCKNKIFTMEYTYIPTGISTNHITRRYLELAY